MAQAIIMNSVCVVSVGDFGRAVADCLRSLHPSLSEDCLSQNVAQRLEFPGNAHVIVIAAWRPCPNLCELADRASHERRTAFIPLILESRMLRLGPIVVPDKSACWGCWSRRHRQDPNWTQELDTIQQYYALHPETGPKGYLEPLATLGAARVSSAINGLFAPDNAAIAGLVWEIDLITREASKSIAVGVHGCPRCGLRRRESTRTVAGLKSELSYLWAPDSVEVT